jgi:2-oxoglutarate ferredoxin oxidoreductase subunit delta
MGSYFGTGGLILSDDSPRVARGTVFVKAEVCKGCAYCIEFCPADCLRFSRSYNEKGYHFPVLASPDACTGCGLCGLYCPDFAIFGMKYRDIDALAEAGKVGAEPGNDPDKKPGGAKDDACGRKS